MKRIICFDMDGTLADLYSVPDWLPKLRAEDASPYADAAPLVDMGKLNEVCLLLEKAGWEIRVITALSKGASPEYKNTIRDAKKAWLDKYGFIYDHFHGVDYKTKKREVIRRAMPSGGISRRLFSEWGGGGPCQDIAILVDDEARHLDGWGWGPTINASETDIIEALIELLPPDLL